VISFPRWRARPIAAGEAVMLEKTRQDSVGLVVDGEMYYL